MCEGGGNCLKYLKKEWNRKQGRGNKDFRKGGKLGQEVGALKGGGGRGWNHHMNYVVEHFNVHLHTKKTSSFTSFLRYYILKNLAI